jgi:hypothetical protein
MYPTWPMVFAALVVGALAGFMQPDRPASRPASAPATPVQAKAAIPENEKSDGIRSVPLTKVTGSEDNGTSSAKARSNSEPVATAGCASKTWPYRVADCLDRTARVAPASTVVKAKRVDPAAMLADAAPAKADTTPKHESAPTRQKVVAAPAPAEKAERPAEAAPAAEAPRAAAQSEPTARVTPRRPPQRLSRDLDFNDGIPTRVYLRGPDGRLYLAPEFRPEGRNRYYAR